jgi:cadmium resistance protein CadD (predicted permease)
VLFVHAEYVLLIALGLVVELDFLGEHLAGMMGLMPVMEELDSLLKTDREQQANGDDGDVNEDIFPGVDSLMRRVGLEHDLAPARNGAMVADAVV